jgi:hypothetical protein
MLKTVAAKQRGKPFRFLWVDLGPFDTPAVLAVNVDKRKFLLHHGAMSAESINSFCEGIMIGRGASFELKDAPRVRDPSLLG